MNNSNKTKAYFIQLTALVVYSLVSIVSKLASNADFLSLRFFVLIGIEFSLLAIYAVLWQIVLKYVPLFVAYVNKGITIFFGLIFGYFIFHENVSYFNIIGTVIISIGIVFMLFEDKQNE